MLRRLRRGAALLEMVVALTLFGAVLSAFGTLVGRHERALATLDARLEATAQLRAGDAALTHDLLAISPAAGDIADARDSALLIRAVVASGVSCDTAGASLALPPPGLDAARALSARLTGVQAGDTAWVWADTGSARSWIPLAITRVTASSSRCRDPAAPLPPPPGGRTIIEFATGPTRPWLVPGAIVRVTRMVRWSLYRGGDNRWWLGMREQAAGSASLTGIQPVLGPLRPYSTDSTRTGALFRYLDATGAALAGGPGANTRVALVRVVLRADSASTRATPHAPAVRDSLVIVVAPRG